MSSQILFFVEESSALTAAEATLSFDNHLENCSFSNIWKENNSWFVAYFRFIYLYFSNQQNRFTIQIKDWNVCLLLICFLRESFVLDINPQMLHGTPLLLICLASMWVFKFTNWEKYLPHARQTYPLSVLSIIWDMISAEIWSVIIFSV